MDILAPKNLKINAISLKEVIVKKLQQVFRDRFFVSDEDWNKILFELLSQKGNMISELYLELVLPAKKHHQPLRNIPFLPLEFIRFLSGDPSKPKGFDPNFHPYLHQYEALNIVQHMNFKKKPSLVITAPTGAGKTEAFLLPMLLDLIKRPRTEKGVRAIIMYPMNALIADQSKRLEKFLVHSTNTYIKAFFYNSETEENNSKEVDQKSYLIDTRKAARENPPDIMITNYSMLEYILSRPEDMPLISSALETIILDEAHLYNGTLAAEISLLLRRILFKANKTSNDILQIATSATLDSSAKQEFFSKLFNKNEDQIHFIEGQKDLADISNPTQHSLLDIQNDAKIVNAYNQNQFFQKYEQDKLFYNIKKYIKDSKKYIYRFDKLIKDLNLSLNENIDDQQFIDILNLGQHLRKNENELPLLAHKLHMQCRFTQGIYVCINAATCPDKNQTLNTGKIHLYKTFSCKKCHAPTLKISHCNGCGAIFSYAYINRKETPNTIIYAKPNIKKSKNQNDEEIEISDNQSEVDRTLILLSSREINDVKSTTICFDEQGKLSSRGINQWYCILNYPKQDDLLSCPCCQNENSYLQSFELPDANIIPLVAETMLNEMPVQPNQYQDILPAYGKRLLAFSDSRKDAARLGYELTRQHEAQLIRKYIYLQLLDLMQPDQTQINKKIKEQLALLNLDENSTDEEELEDIRRIKKRLQNHIPFPTSVKISNLILEFKKKSNPYNIFLYSSEVMRQDFKRSDLNHTHDPKRTMDENQKGIIEKDIYEKIANEIAIPTMRFNTLEKLGLIEVIYPNIEALCLPESLINLVLTQQEYEILSLNYVDLLKGFFYLIRLNYAMNYKDNYKPFGYIESRYVVFANRMRQNQDDQDDHKYVNLSMMKPENKIYQWIEQCLKSIGVNTNASKINHFFNILFDDLYDKISNGDISWLKDTQRETQNNSFNISYEELDIIIPKKLFVNFSENKIYTHFFNNKVFIDHEIKTFTTYTHLIEINQDDINQNKLELALKSKKLPILTSRNKYKDPNEGIYLNRGLWSAEHSAQINPQENRRKQDLFSMGLRNILSATTTLEVGIDIGDLTGVLMANFPANKANYIQRAGRVGRRSDGSSIVLTYAKNNHFNQNVFHQFEDYISRDLKKLTITLEKKKILFRHFNSLMVSLFYEKNTTITSVNSFNSIGQFLGFENSPPYISSKSEVGTEYDPRTSFDSSSASNLIDFLKKQKSNLNTLSNRLDDVFDKTELKNIFLDSKSSIHSYEDLLDEFVMKIENLFQILRREISQMHLNWQKPIQETIKDEDLKRIKNFIRYAINEKSRVPLIGILVNAQLLPRYGFRIDILNLHIQTTENDRDKNINEKISLQRSANIAISEYVPDTVLLADGWHIRSSAVLKHYSGANITESYGELGRSFICEKGHFFKRPLDDTKISKCQYPNCDEPIKLNDPYLIPKGYSTSLSEYHKFKYNSKIQKIGNIKYFVDISDTNHHNIMEINRPKFSIKLKENMPIYCQNSGLYAKGFSICKHCGFTQSSENDKARPMLSAKMKNHISIYSLSQKCNPGLQNIWHNHILVAEFKTDAILFIFPVSQNINYSALTALCNALQLSATDILGLDEREIAYLILETNDREIKVLFYDVLSGGVGYVHDLSTNRLDDWLEATKKKLWISDEHHQVCDFGCIQCIVTLKTEEALDRKGAYQYFICDLQQ